MGDRGEKGKAIKKYDGQLGKSHEGVKDSTGNAANNMAVTLCGARWG